MRHAVKLGLLVAHWRKTPGPETPPPGNSNLTLNLLNSNPNRRGFSGAYLSGAFSPWVISEHQNYWHPEICGFFFWALISRLLPNLVHINCVFSDTRGPLLRMISARQFWKSGRVFQLFCRLCQSDRTSVFRGKGRNFLVVRGFAVGFAGSDAFWCLL